MLVDAKVRAYTDKDDVLTMYYQDYKHGDDVTIKVHEDGSIWLSEYDYGISDFKNTRKITLKEYFELIQKTQIAD
jgi:hypothetical protein